MRKTTIVSVRKWFETYQPVTSREEAVEYVSLYERLIDEEREELLEAIANNDAVEMMDAFADLAWVEMGYYHFANYDMKGYAKSFEETFEVTIYDRLFGVSRFSDLMDEVARSNFSKSLELQEDGAKKGKVVKGPNFFKPNILSVMETFHPNYGCTSDISE